MFCCFFFLFFFFFGLLKSFLYQILRWKLWSCDGGADPQEALKKSADGEKVDINTVLPLPDKGTSGAKFELQLFCPCASEWKRPSEHIYMDIRAGPAQLPPPPEKCNCWQLQNR